MEDASPRPPAVCGHGHHLRLTFHGSLVDGRAQRRPDGGALVDGKAASPQRSGHALQVRLGRLESVPSAKWPGAPVRGRTGYDVKQAELTAVPRKIAGIREHRLPKRCSVEWNKNASHVAPRLSGFPVTQKPMARGAPCRPSGKDCS